ncbi:hypothetical protein CBM2605_B100346 [Cupriavidus neocaledonicus]|uniref:Uncharacterized protein n=1 Tax=Cupriavidus neocaledonicus TaxID=1040979 RepID=A0ABY1V9Z7_9BURK|nr:hypothetical protein CBM2605_B100346 [Cupriavidus neocaledonicus]
MCSRKRSFKGNEWELPMRHSHSPPRPIAASRGFLPRGLFNACPHAPRPLTALQTGADIEQSDMTFRVNRNVWFAVVSYANEFPEGGVTVNLDGGSS